MRMIEVTVTKVYTFDSASNEVTYGSDVATGRVGEHAAVMWLLDMFVRHECQYGEGLMVHDVSENFVDISSMSFRLPGDISNYTTHELETEGLYGWSYEFSGTHEQLSSLKDMVLICIRSIAGNYPELTGELIDKIALQQMEREFAMA